jgi:hypothetical protein
MRQATARSGIGTCKYPPPHYKYPPPHEASYSKIWHRREIIDIIYALFHLKAACNHTCLEPVCLPHASFFSYVSLTRQFVVPLSRAASINTAPAGGPYKDTDNEEEDTYMSYEEEDTDI